MSLKLTFRLQYLLNTVESRKNGRSTMPFPPALNSLPIPKKSDTPSLEVLQSVKIGMI